MKESINPSNSQNYSYLLLNNLKIPNKGYLLQLQI
ncbi:unnamed protein product [Paramecium octaurelia]|uniref:Uncharacterized protein n=1 Tax=Paramecium octaurelia TaxID=43137 RepID=A0A8S1VLA1_PAROT|nr:unnamed protein product [Paramecium octaurelia]